MSTGAVFVYAARVRISSASKHAEIYAPAYLKRECVNFFRYVSAYWFLYIHWDVHFVENLCRNVSIAKQIDRTCVIIVLMHQNVLTAFFLFGY